MKAATRSYRMVERAESAAATRSRILVCAERLTKTSSFDEITLEEVAACAGTTVRTVLRSYGSKEGLLAAALDAMGFNIGPTPIRPGETDTTLIALYDYYEKYGDMVIRWLADEPRLPSLRAHLEAGRRDLRAGVELAFQPVLEKLAGSTRKETLDALIVGLDVYTWKLLRRDFGLGRKAAQSVARRIIAGLVEGG